MENEQKKDDKIQIYTPADSLPEMLHNLKNGKEKGSTTHNEQLDKCWKWRKTEFTLWTGYSNEGKSELFRQMALMKALKDNWKFVFNAPEDIPIAEFWDAMIHTLTGQPTDKDHTACISEKLYLEAFELIRDKFFFVHIRPPHNTIKEALTAFKRIIDENDIDACLLDPLIKFSRPKDGTERDDLYANYVNTVCTHFAREEHQSLHLIMHQLTPKATEAGFYPKPNMYTVKGGGSFVDGADNLLSVWRPKYAKDKLDTSTTFSSQKIKRQKLVGFPQDLDLTFDRRTNRYRIFNKASGVEEDLFNFDQFLPKVKSQLYYR